MVSKTAILSAFVATATANAVVRPAHVARAELQARQTEGGAATKCAADFASVYSSSPTPPPEIFSYGLDHPLTDWCNYSVPSSLETMFSSYESAVSSWVQVNVRTINALASSCPIYSMITVSPPCWTGAAANAQPTATSAGGASSRSSGNAGTRETGMVAAAVAAAGVIGAVAAL